MNKNLQNKTLEFIEKAIKKHGYKYDYSKVEYTGSHNKVCIICSEHGEFYQSATNHLSGNVRYKMIHINNFTNFLHHIMLSKQHNMLLF